MSTGCWNVCNRFWTGSLASSGTSIFTRSCCSSWAGFSPGPEGNQITWRCSGDCVANKPSCTSNAFGFYETDLLVEALRTGRREEVPEYLTLFREHPVAQVDQFARVIDLLAWRGCESEFRATAIRRC
jgi:hypothetical protein